MESLRTRYLIAKVLTSRSVNSNQIGQLRHIRKLRPWPLTSLLYDRYGFKKEAADQIAAFIEETVRIVPEDRKSAAELLTHHWLS